MRRCRSKNNLTFSKTLRHFIQRLFDAVVVVVVEVGAFLCSSFSFTATLFQFRSRTRSIITCDIFFCDFYINLFLKFRLRLADANQLCDVNPFGLFYKELRPLESRYIYGALCPHVVFVYPESDGNVSQLILRMLTRFANKQRDLE